MPNFRSTHPTKPRGIATSSKYEFRTTVARHIACGVSTWLLSGLLGAMENGASASANRRASTASPAGAGGRRAPQLPAVSCRLARTACLPERPRPASRRRSRGAPGGDAATSATGVRVREAERGSIRTVQVEIEVEGLGAASGWLWGRTVCGLTGRNGSACVGFLHFLGHMGCILVMIRPKSKTSHSWVRGPLWHLLVLLRVRWAGQ
jgi:hypothetical protein